MVLLLPALLLSHTERSHAARLFECLTLRKDFAILRLFTRTFSGFVLIIEILIAA